MCVHFCVGNSIGFGKISYYKCVISRAQFFLLVYCTGFSLFEVDSYIFTNKLHVTEQTRTDWLVLKLSVSRFYT